MSGGQIGVLPSPSVASAAVLQSPPTVHATQLSVSMNVAEVSLTFGQLRQLIDPRTGQPAQQTGLEWLLTVNLPAPVVELLYDSLGSVLRAYRQRFGAIPRDPNVSMVTSEVAQEPPG